MSEANTDPGRQSQPLVGMEAKKRWEPRGVGMTCSNCRRWTEADWGIGWCAMLNAIKNFDQTCKKFEPSNTSD